MKTVSILLALCVFTASAEVFGQSEDQADNDWFSTDCTADIVAGEEAEDGEGGEREGGGFGDCLKCGYSSEMVYRANGLIHPYCTTVSGESNAARRTHGPAGCII